MKTTLNSISPVLFVLFIVGTASAAIESRDILKTYFETGDVPTQDQFSNLIDSFIHKTEDGLSVTGIEYTASASNPATKKYVDDTVNALNNFADIGSPGVSIPAMQPEFGGQSGFLALRLANSLGTFYGYFQVRMDDPLLIAPPGIHVDYFVFNNVPGEPITISSVPEPASISLLALGATLLLMSRRKRPWSRAA